MNTDKRPNVVIIMTDQQQARACKREGFPLDTTPFIDSCARDGIWFDRAYTPTPVCGPARVSLLTGRYPSAHGVRANPALKSGASYSQDIFDVMRHQGYATAMIGKNHSHLSADRVDHWFSLGHAAGYGNPASQLNEQEKAFDTWLYDLHHGVSDVPTPFPPECQGPHRIVSDAERWIASLDSGVPFFAWLSFAEPHNPYQAPEPYFSLFPREDLPPVFGDSPDAQPGFKWEFLGKMERMAMPNYDDILPRMRTNYYGMLRMIDDQVRRFVSILEETGRMENTLCIFVSDHGDFVGDYRLMRKGPELPESLIRVPFVVWGDGVEARLAPVPAHVNLVDVFPTICGHLGIAVPDGVQGRDLDPLLRGEPYPEPEFDSAYAEHGFGGLDYTWDDEIDFEKCMPPAITFDCLNQYTQCGSRRMVRTGPWKLIFDSAGHGKMYNLDDDPGELENLFTRAEYGSQRGELLAELLTLSIRAEDPVPPPGGAYERKSHPRNYWTDETFIV